ncbi:MAG TPA: BON domain-containing protein [Burkholderiales bacterium]|nr:BON domain-containing protein [Burkholderiales bacterium]
MKKSMKWLSAMLVTSALSGGAYAHEGEAKPDASNPTPDFAALDTDHDGYISREEARKWPNFERAFNETDINHDDRLDPEEFAVARSLYDRIRVGTYVDDSVITTKVKAMLLTEPVVKSTAINVTTYRGTVLLSGFVDDGDQAKRAEDVASKVHGVVSVKNSLVVKN